MILIVLSGPIYHRLTASSSASFTFRRNLITIALNMWRDHPWLGTGLNNFTIVMAKYDPIGLTKRRISPVHNLYFLTAAETGILGLIAFSWLLIGVFSEGWQILKSRDLFLASCAAGILGGLVAVLMHSNLGWLWRYDVVYVAFWFLVGYVLSIRRLSGCSAAFKPI
jgi:putative inorganic carbon (HCO3(-)) transporter